MSDLQSTEHFKPSTDIPARHYSYECKEAAQDRPYKARPSRTQQLLNPKLKPRLTEETLEPNVAKKGAADAELAKREADRIKKRELESRDSLSPSPPPSKRRRSGSMSSLSSISTRSSRSSPARRHSPSPRRVPHREDEDDAGGQRRPRATDYLSDEDDRGQSRRLDDRNRHQNGSTSSRRGSGDAADRAGVRRRSYSSSLSRSRSPPERRPPEPRRDPSQREMARPPPRERSLSPFSKRLALTEAMNR